MNKTKSINNKNVKSSETRFVSGGQEILQKLKEYFNEQKRVYILTKSGSNVKGYIKEIDESEGLIVIVNSLTYTESIKLLKIEKIEYLWIEKPEIATLYEPTSERLSELEKTPVF